MTAVRVITGADATIAGVNFTCQEWRVREVTPRFNATGRTATCAKTVDGDHHAELRLLGVLDSTETPPRAKSVLTVVLTTRSGLVYTQDARVTASEQIVDKRDNGAGPQVIVIEAVIEDATSGSILNP